MPHDIVSIQRQQLLLRPGHCLYRACHVRSHLHPLELLISLGKHFQNLRALILWLLFLLYGKVLLRLEQGGNRLILELRLAVILLSAVDAADDVFLVDENLALR